VSSGSFLVLPWIEFELQTQLEIARALKMGDSKLMSTRQKVCRTEGGQDEFTRFWKKTSNRTTVAITDH